MGNIDTLTKEYLSQNDVFADAFNYLLFDGSPVIQPEHLHELDTTDVALPYGSDGAKEVVQRYRDVLKEWAITYISRQDEHAAYVILGLENQSHIHYAMPVRTMIYDALQYEKQVASAKASYSNKDNPNKPKLKEGEYLSGFRKTDKLLPVITLVIYWGAEVWDGPLSIHDMLDVKTAPLKPFVQDYKIHLIAPYQIADDAFDKFHTGLGPLLLCMKHSKDKDMRILENPIYDAIDYKTAQLINELTNMNISIDEYLDAEKGCVNMCIAFENTKQQMLEIGRAEGLTQGRAEGLLEGEQKTLVKLVKNKLTKGYDAETISEHLGLSITSVQALLIECQLPTT